MTENKQHQPVQGFSRLTKQEKIDWLANEYIERGEWARNILAEYQHTDAGRQKLHDDFIENTLSNYFLPFGIAPNFLINDKYYALPMAIEESSVVAAAANSASFWKDRGGFRASVVGTLKVGHVHFVYYGEFNKLKKLFETTRNKMYEDTDPITKNMRKRGGGIHDIVLINKTYEEPNYYQIKATFETCDSMGANFINSCLEQFAETFLTALQASNDFSEEEKANTQIIMCILSNYTPECLVRAEVSCPVEELHHPRHEMSAEEFAQKFERAIHVARIEPYRATTHNKGIMNGIDAVVIATGNDFRAIEAAAHTYAARTGQYRSLTDCKIENGQFTFWLEMPMSVGVVGGLTKLHPMVTLALEILGNPNAKELMQVIAVSGLAQNFGALRALTTSGIQKGHMKMHLLNICNQLGANTEEKEIVKKEFADKVPTHQAVVEFIEGLRS